MAKDQSGFPGHLSFSQRYGYEPLPEPMRLEKISEDVRREIWNAIREPLLEYRTLYPTRGRYGLTLVGRRFIERVLGKLKRVPEDEINANYYENVRDNLKGAVLSGDFNHVLDVVEIIVNDRGTTDEMKERLGQSLMNLGHTGWTWRQGHIGFSLKRAGNKARRQNGLLKHCAKAVWGAGGALAWGSRTYKHAAIRGFYCGQHQGR